MYIHIHLTEGAVQIVNHMLMFAVVKHWHGVGIILPPTNAQIRRVNCYGRHVSDQMQNKRSANQLDGKCEGLTTIQTYSMHT